MITTISTPYNNIQRPLTALPAHQRAGKIELFVGATDAVEAVMAQPVPANQPVLRLSTNTYESQEDHGLFAPTKPIDKTLFAHADADNIMPNGAQGSDAGYYYPLKKGQSFGIRITDNDVGAFLTNVGVDNWPNLVANPIHLTRALGDYLKQRLYKDANSKPVTIQEVATIGITGGANPTTEPRKPVAVARKSLNVLA